jgi:hypothetical protein
MAKPLLPDDLWALIQPLLVILVQTGPTSSSNRVPPEWHFLKGHVSPQVLPTQRVAANEVRLSQVACGKELAANDPSFGKCHSGPPEFSDQPRVPAAGHTHLLNLAAFFAFIDSRKR